MAGLLDDLAISVCGALDCGRTGCGIGFGLPGDGDVSAKGRDLGAERGSLAPGFCLGLSALPAEAIDPESDRGDQGDPAQRGQQRTSGLRQERAGKGDGSERDHVRSPFR